MDLPSWIDDIEDVKSGLCVSNKDALSATLGDSITTPSASEWTDISFHCGAGSEEGDTFNYECVDCRSKHTSIEDLNSHLLTSAAHVVCPICVMEFSGQNNQVKEMSRKDHILKVSCVVLVKGHRGWLLFIYSTNKPDRPIRIRSTIPRLKPAKLPRETKKGSMIFVWSLRTLPTWPCPWVLSQFMVLNPNRIQTMKVSRLPLVPIAATRKPRCLHGRTRPVELSPQ